MEFSKIIIIIYLSWNLFCFILMGIDKLKSINSRHRISEFTLIITSFFMGAIGILLGMVIFRHKIRKSKFIILIPIALIENIFALYIISMNF